MSVTISRRSDYAVRALVYLAARDGGSAHRVGEIARNQGVPVPFLAKIVQQLVAAGLLKSRRGRAGGVYLPAEAASSSVLDVVQAIDGPVALNWCTMEPKRCGRWEMCAAHPLWARAQRLLEEVLGGASIAELADAQRRIDALTVVEGNGSGPRQSGRTPAKARKGGAA